MGNIVGKSAALAYQTWSALLLDHFTSRRNFSGMARAAVRYSYFYSRARIPVISLADFCANFSTELQSTILLPAFSTEHNEGIGADRYFTVLATICASLQPRQIVEFGTFLGLSALTFALNAPQARILTIDLPDDAANQDYLDATDQKHVDISRNRVGKWFKGTPQEPRISELRCDSRQLKLIQEVNSAELVLVDGGHDLGCIRADTENAFAVASPGGVILWDDYFWLYPDVITYLDALAGSHKLWRIDGTSVVAHIAK